MREIALDTETTGLNPYDGHRIVEIGCVELEHHIPTGSSFHMYINPERDMPEEAFKIHGLSEDFLKQYPVFGEVCQEFLDFIQDSRLIIHNAKFDIGFINAELERENQPLIPLSRAEDTVFLARKKFPGMAVNLDALCRYFEVDNTHREKHGALLDAELLAEVYLHLKGGRQQTLGFSEQKQKITKEKKVITKSREKRDIILPENDLKSHKDFLSSFKNALWHQLDM